MFLLVDVSGTGLTGQDFARRLLDERLVSVMPGDSFGAVGRSLLRLSLTVRDDRLAEACGRIAAFAADLARDPEGRERLAS